MQTLQCGSGNNNKRKKNRLSKNKTQAVLLAREWMLPRRSWRQGGAEFVTGVAVVGEAHLSFPPVELGADAGRQLGPEEELRWLYHRLYRVVSSQDSFDWCIRQCPTIHAEPLSRCPERIHWWWFPGIWGSSVQHFCCSKVDGACPSPWYLLRSTIIFETVFVNWLSGAPRWI